MGTFYFTTRIQISTRRIGTCWAIPDTFSEQWFFFSSVNNAFYRIKWAHEVNGLQDPTTNSFVTSVLEASKGTASKKTEKKDPISTETLIEICTMFKDSTDLLIIRDLTMMLLIFSGFLRYDEISSLRFNKRIAIFPLFLWPPFFVFFYHVRRTVGKLIFAFCLLFCLILESIDNTNIFSRFEV
jgi:hypothetical protein